MNELMTIERLTGTAVLEASALCNPNVDRRAAEKIEGDGTDLTVTGNNIVLSHTLINSVHSLF